ncbi:hypothetical protein [Alishewanella phage vB_AspM_Slicko01]|nr:hypothetical protein [Alishewanella phage vB_AspM_Slicko01]
MDIKRIIRNTEKANNGCWNWNKSCNSAGYGQLTESKKYWLAHRYAYICKFGIISDDLIVRHKCSNSKCCNPDHLVLGTHKQNYADSKLTHKAANIKSRSVWQIDGVVYNTIREAALKTGLSMSSLVKYTNNGIFDIASYRRACIISRNTPKV